MDEKKYYGYMKTYEVGEIVASGKVAVDISDADVDQFKYFNSLDILNSSAVDVAVYLDDNTDRQLRVIAGTNKAMNGTFFQRLIIENKSGAVAVASGEIIVTVQKEMGFREHVDELGEELRR